MKPTPNPNLGTQPSPELHAFIVKTITETVLPEALQPGILPPPPPQSIQPESVPE